MSVGHYENFPVASALLPARARRAVVAIYRFARAADDLADEGDAPAAARHAALDAFEAQLRTIERGGTPGQPLFAELAVAVRTHALPLAPFFDLLSAFRQDVDITRYSDYDSLLDYCRRSANPVGRLLLALYGVHGLDAVRESDAICTALQLANFWQDVAIDWRKGRVYLPLADLAAFDVSLDHVRGGIADARWARMMRFETARTRALFETGQSLPHRMPWRAGLELRAVIAGGLRILECIDAVGGNVFAHRPQLRKRDWLLLAFRVLVPQRAGPAAAA